MCKSMLKDFYKYMASFKTQSCLHDNFYQATTT